MRIRTVLTMVPNTNYLRSLYVAINIRGSNAVILYAPSFYNGSMREWIVPKVDVITRHVRKKSLLVNFRSSMRQAAGVWWEDSLTRYWRISRLICTILFKRTIKSTRKSQKFATVKWDYLLSRTRKTAVMYLITQQDLLTKVDWKLKFIMVLASR